MIVDLAAARLNNVDILSTDRVLDLKTALTDREFRQDSLAWSNTECVADGLYQLWVRLSAVDDNIARHCW